MDANQIFYNELGRVRSGWRAAAYLASFVLVGTFLLVLAVALLSGLPIGFSPRSFLSYIVQFSISFAVAAFFGWFYGKYFEDLPFRALGLWLTANWWRDLVLGLVIGALSLCAAALIAYLAGGKTFRVNDEMGSSAVLLTLFTSLVIFVAGAAFEETLFRGYPLQTLARARLALFGTLLTSLLFATMHNSNPGASLLSWFNTFLAGIWLAAAYFKTRNLWFPFGVHLTWNWFQGSILGINVSGLKELTAAPVLLSNDLGPEWLTGGEYGLEAGVACTIALVASTAAIWFAPFLKPTDELLALTSAEKPVAIAAGSREI